MKGNPIMPDDEFDALKTKVSLLCIRITNVHCFKCCALL